MLITCLILSRKTGDPVDYFEGAMNKERSVLGSYIHGIFDGVVFREDILNKIRAIKGLELKGSRNMKALEKENWIS